MAKRPCAQPGCREVVWKGRCPKHTRARRRRVDRARGSASARGYGVRWRKASRAFLARPENAFCRICYAGGFDPPPGDRVRIITRARVVDHIVPHRGDPVLFWDEANWQSLCDERGFNCHGKKTAAETGFGGQAPGARERDEAGPTTPRRGGRKEEGR